MLYTYWLKIQQIFLETFKEESCLKWNMMVIVSQGPSVTNDDLQGE